LLCYFGLYHVTAEILIELDDKPPSNEDAASVTILTMLTLVSADHSNMVKFSSASDSGFHLLFFQLQLILDQVTVTVEGGV